MASRRRTHTNSDSSADDEDDTRPSPSPPPAATNHTPRGQLRARSNKYNSAPRQVSRRHNSDSEPSSDEEVVRPVRRPSIAKKSPKGTSSRANPNGNANSTSKKSNATPARSTKRTSRKPKHLSDFDHEDVDLDEDSDPSIASQDDADEDEDVDADEDSDGDQDVEMDDDEDEDEPVTRTPPASTKIKSSRKSSSKSSRSSSARKPKSKSHKSSASKSKSSRKKSSSKSRSAPEAGSGRRNPTRTTRGRNSLFENNDDENDEFLVTDAEDDEPRRRQSEAKDSADELMAPSMSEHRLMEKILGRRLKSPLRENDNSDDSSSKKAENVDMKEQDDDKMDTTPDTGSSNKEGDAAAATKEDDKKSKKSEEVKADKKSDGDASGTPGTTEEPVYEYLIKWKKLSHIHCEWVSEELIYSQPQGKSRLNRFLSKQDIRDMQRGTDINTEADEDDLIPEDFVTVDRILSDRINSKEMLEYLVKWCSLPYADSTWEIADDVKDDNKIEEFAKRNAKPPAQRLIAPPRPEPSEYRRLPMPKFRNNGELRDYQMEGFNWLVNCWFNRQGCILADEMGLGKTIQSVSFINELYTGRKILGPFLVLAPLSTLGHWQREFETWTEMNAIVYHGSTESRRIISEYEWSYGTPQKGPPFKWHVMITTYETILQEANKLRHINWKAMVVDEAHRLKNRNSRLVDELVAFKSDHRVLLTGTPIQNNSMEVHALLHFLEPDNFMSEEEFAAQFGDIKDAATVDKLKALLRPFLLRRLKEDVEKSIPPKEETVISVELTRVQKKWYRAIYDNNFSFLDKGKRSNNVGNLRNIVMELRKCCNHPYLIKGVEEIESSALPAGADRAAHMSHLVSASGKMVLVDKLLPQLKEQGSRVLVFSQMIRVLDILEDYLLEKRWGYERIDGRVRGNDRQQAIDRYSKPDSDKFVFLLCTRAGGQGINLTCADTVIIYDSDWNPQNDVQAQARCHRIGQKTKVKIYRLITRGTYEQNMFDRASKKLGLDQAILQNMGKTESVFAGAVNAKAKNKNTSLLNDMNRTDIDSLLKKGAYDVFNEDNAAADAFTSEDIHQILTGRTRVLSSTAANAGPSEFSKASFKVEKDDDENKGDLALDDPDFWKKLMPEASKAPDPNIEVLPRRRRQTVRYQPKLGFDTSDEDDDEEEASGDEGPAKLGPNGKRLFNKGERHRLQRALCSMGWGRWHEILEYAGAPVTDRRNVDDVAQFCKALMRCCWEMAEKNLSEDPKFQVKIAEIKKRIEDVLEDAYAPHRAIVGKARKKSRSNPKDEESEDESDSEAEGTSDEYGNLLGPVNSDPDFVNFTDPILTSAEYDSYLSRNASSILERMELLGNIRNLYKDGSLNEGSEMPTVGASGSQAVEVWWDNAFDRDLLRGTFKHGYSNHERLLKDPELCFLGRVLQPQKEKRANTAEKSNGRNGSDSDGEGRKKKKKSDGGAGTGSDSDDDGKTDDEKSAKNSPQPVMFVPEEEFKVRKWPPVNVLNVRVRKLVRGFERMRKRAERVAKQEEDQEKSRRLKEEKRIAREKQQEEHAAEKSRKLAEANRHWSKKEKHDFCKYFSSTGAPPLDNGGKQSWALVKERAHLGKKDPAQLQTYAKEFKAMCDVMVRADEWIKKHKSSLAKFFEEMGPKVDEKDAGADGEDKITKAKKSKKPTVPYTLQQMEDARVTIVNAKKFTERNTMITTLRREVLKELNKPATKALIEKKGAPGARERLPDWWRENRQVVDVALLQGIATHGFDPAQTALDGSLPFRNLLAQNVIDYITETLSTHNTAPEFNADSYVIPKDITEVADADILTFFPKDKMIIGRLQRLINVVTKQQKEGDEPMPLPSEPVTSTPRSKPSGGGGRKRTIGSVGNAALGDSGNLVVMDKGILAGAIPTAFEAAPTNRMTRKLLKFLKQQKKMNSNQVLKLELPDWSPIDSEFSRMNADGSEYKGAKRRRVNGTAPTGGPKKESQAPSSSVGTNLNVEMKEGKDTKEPKVMESMMHKVSYDDEGNIIYPIRLGVLTIESLGKIEHERKGWHTERYIYPIGFKTVREFTSMVDVGRTCEYVCEILDEGGIAPMFQVTCMDTGTADEPVTPTTLKDSSSSACWTRVMTAIRDNTPEDRKRLHTTVSGPEYFGLSNVLVQELMQNMENVDKLAKYKRKTFVDKILKNGEVGNGNNKKDEGAMKEDENEDGDEYDDEAMNMEDVSDEEMEEENENEAESDEDMALAPHERGLEHDEPKEDAMEESGKEEMDGAAMAAVEHAD